MLPNTRTPRARGFTLIELVVAISISGILVAASSALILAPINAQRDQSRRAALSSEADLALRAVAADLDSAIPGTARVTGTATGATLEMLIGAGSAAVRTNDTSVAAALNLELNVPEAAFSTLNEFSAITRPFASSTTPALVFDPAAGPDDAYDSAVAQTTAGTSVSIVAGPAPGQDLVTLAPAYRFSPPGSVALVHLVAGPVAYVCDTNARRLTRYSGYAATRDRTQRDSSAELLAAGASAVVAAEDVTACRLSSGAPTASRGAVLAMSLTITRDGESAVLASQFMQRSLL